MNSLFGIYENMKFSYFEDLGLTYIFILIMIIPRCLLFYTSKNTHFCQKLKGCVREKALIHNKILQYQNRFETKERFKFMFPFILIALISLSIFLLFFLMSLIFILILFFSFLLILCQLILKIYQARLEQLYL